MIRAYLLIVFVLVGSVLCAQLVDEFSDGDFTTAPAWSGDVADFVVEAGELRLSAPAASDESHLSTASEAIQDATWIFDVRMEFNPTVSNRTKVYLTSDSPDLEGDLNGYYVLLGNNSDEIRLVRQSGDTDNTLIDGTDDVIDLEPVLVRVMVTRDDVGNWTLAHDVGITGAMVTEGSVFDDTYNTSAYFGLLCDYSTANSASFYFDNIAVTGTGFVDTTPPTVVSVSALDSDRLSVTYSEPVDASTALLSANYLWQPDNSPTQVTSGSSSSEVILEFASDFPLNTTQQVDISGVTDLAGNEIAATQESFIYEVELPEVLQVSTTGVSTLSVVFNKPMDMLSAENTANYTWVNGGATISASLSADETTVSLAFDTEFPTNELQTLTIGEVIDIDGIAVTADEYGFVLAVVQEVDPGDVLINEILADPDEDSQLPDAEYIELVNVSSKTFSTMGWSVIDGGTARALPEVVLLPGEYVIVCHEDNVPLFDDFGGALGLSSFTLTNGGETIGLEDEESEMIDEVSYSSDWYGGTSSDGVSLERISLLTPCSSSSNWGPSEASIGGTPGATNSIFSETPDDEPPTVVEVILIDESTIDLLYSEPLDELSTVVTVFELIGDDGSEIITELPMMVDPFTFRLPLAAPLTQGVLYTLTTLGAIDCSGNAMEVPSEGFVALADEATIDDVIINEVLFNPIGDGVDYVELYNKSDKYIDLNDWKLGRIGTDGEEDFDDIANRYRLLLPGSYVLLSPNSGRVLLDYPLGRKEAFYQMESFPAYSNDEGTVLLRSSDDILVDEFYYTEDYHFALLDDVDGVSLERISFDRPSNDPTNWHSASATSGFGTPGYENSQNATTIIPSSSFTVVPEIFSPDNDGFDDVVTISYSLDAPGYVASTTIYDRNGRLIKRLKRGELLGVEGAYSWDGLTDDRRKARIGVYIIYIEIFDAKGNVSSLKKTCVLAGQL